MAEEPDRYKYRKVGIKERLVRRSRVQRLRSLDIVRRLSFHLCNILIRELLGMKELSGR
jgi:hypothetical protein